MNLSQKCQKFEHFREQGFLPFLKKVLGLKKESYAGYSEAQKKRILWELGQFNAAQGTNFWINFQRVGQSYCYEVTGINGGLKQKNTTLVVQLNSFEQKMTYC